MKNFIKGFRFTPSNYPAAVEDKIQKYRKQGYKLPPRKVLRTPEQLEGIRESAKINTALLDHIAENIREGMSTEEIDRLVYDFTTGHGAVPAPLNYEGFPKSVCTSINDVVCHGIPNKNEILKNGDIINVDVSTIYNGYFSDASRMFMIGDVSPEMRKLVQVTKECMEIGIATAQPWKQLGDVGAAIQEHAEKNGFSVVRDLCGHGVGMKFHEEPDVEHFGRRGTGMMIVPGMTFTIEPMINMGTYEVFVDEADGWTVCTDDGLPSAQWENMILITETGNEFTYCYRRISDSITCTITNERQQPKSSGTTASSLTATNARKPGRTEPKYPGVAHGNDASIKSEYAATPGCPPQEYDDHRRITTAEIRHNGPPTGNTD